MPKAAEKRATPFHLRQLPSEAETIRPKKPRLQSHTQSEPPMTPVYSYHCTLWVLPANAWPSTSQGQDMSTSKYLASQAIHIAARKIYGSGPRSSFPESRKRPHITVI